MKKLYVGCALTHAPEEFRQRISALKDRLRGDYEVLDFFWNLNKPGTPKDIYEWDINKCVAECDAFLAVCDFPSLGLGYEMATVVEKLSKPTLAVAQADAKVGRIILGINQPHFRFARYTSLDEIPSMLNNFIAEMSN